MAFDEALQSVFREERAQAVRLAVVESLQLQARQALAEPQERRK